MTPLASSYAAARTRFLAAVDAAGGDVITTPHPLEGREGEALAIDVASLGPADADDVVIVVSGTHGVEGYLGSALQSAHLEAGIDRLDDVLLVMVHALNPFGFSWVRRVNEDNVDLNRNFIDWSAAAPTNPEYGEIAESLVPGDWSDATQERTLLELLGLAESLGLEQLQAIVTGGQYEHPTGVFYGGAGPTWSNRWLTDYLRSLGRRDHVAIIDLHTGLGPWGHGELISCDAPDSDAFRRQTDWWGEVTSFVDGSSVSAELEGNWQAMLPDVVDAPEITAVGLEYGTVDPITVLQSLRADAVLWSSGDPAAPEASAVRDQVRAAFCDDDPAWFDACCERYRSVVGTCLERIV